MKICPYPFSRLQTIYNADSVEYSGAFYPCCSSWFTEDYQNIPIENNINDVWNGKAAILLREKILNGDFSFCNRSVCKMPLVSIEELETNKIGYIETPISKNNLEAIKNKNPIMPDLPSSLHLSADLRCNLSCKICRAELIPNSKELKRVKDEYDYVHRAKDNLQIIKMASGGELFYSTQQRELLKSFNKNDFPKLERIHVVSNGVLFNQKAYDDLLPGSEFIRDVSISIDAGTKETYLKMRGAYWEQLNENLIWISKMRRSGKFDFFTLNFTVVKDNYKDIPALIELGKKLRVDRILLQKFLEVGGQGYNKDEIIEQSIHLSSHPLYNSLIEILNKYKDDRIVYTLLDIDGFENKIERDLNVQRDYEYYNLAVKAFEENELEKSYEYIQKSIEVNKDDYKTFLLSKITFAIGMKLGLEFNLEQSIEFIKKSIEHDVYKKSDEISYVQSLLKDKIYAAEKTEDVVQTEFIIKLYQNLFQLDNHLNLVYAMILSRKNLDEKALAIQSLQEIIKNKDNGWAKDATVQLFYLCVDLARDYKRQQDFKKSISFFDYALLYSPSDEKRLGILKEKFYVHLDYGFQLKTIGDGLHAISQFEIALQLDLNIEDVDLPKYINETKYYYYRDLGFKNQSQQKYILGIEFFEFAKDTGHLDKDFCFSYGICLKRKKRYEEALSSFFQSIELGNKTFLPELEIASIYILSDRPQLAILILNKINVDRDSLLMKRVKVLTELATRKIKNC